jgi:hypothetical protein
LSALCTYMLTYVQVGRKDRPCYGIRRGYVAHAARQEDGGRPPSGDYGSRSLLRRDV